MSLEAGRARTCLVMSTPAIVSVPMISRSCLCRYRPTVDFALCDLKTRRRQETLALESGSFWCHLHGVHLSPHVFSVARSYGRRYEGVRPGHAR